jgi:hypothetical protein
MVNVVTMVSLAFATALTFVAACGPKEAQEPRAAPEREVGRKSPLPPRSAEGEPCSAPGHCHAGLECVQGTCVKPRATAIHRSPTLGIAVCDTYLDVYRCYFKSLPPDARGLAEKAYFRMIESWKKTIDASGEPAKEAIAKGCRKALAAFVKVLVKVPTAKHCLPKAGAGAPAPGATSGSDASPGPGATPGSRASTGPDASTGPGATPGSRASPRPGTTPGPGTSPPARKARP